MNERLSLAETIFHEVIGAPPDERAAILAERTAGDSELRTLVERLLAHDQKGMGAFLTPPNRTAAARPAASDTTAWVGPYRILSVLAAGGMGTVYRARQTRPVEREVALKVIRAGLDSREIVARFETERRTLARMDHPNIARVLDAGETEQGHPYFVMELIYGIPITEYCDSRRLRVPDRLELFRTVCEAVQHAHQKAVIHRDLKPSNVLVAEVDGKPVPKVIDFGVAKALGRGLADETMHTIPGMLIGTPEYMSPEQVDPDSADLDTRSDVYSLGVMLYELLVGSRPFEGGDALSVMRRIREEEPKRPSTRMVPSDGSSVERARARGIETRTLRRLLRRDLDWIVMKALEKDRSRRYASAAELAADVQRYLRDESVEARPPSRGYRTLKFVRRHRLGVTAPAIVVMALAGFAVLTGAQNQRIAAERDRADRERTEAERESAKATRIQEFLQDMLSSIDPYATDFRSSELTVREVLDAAAARVGSELAGQPEVEASVRYTIGVTYKSLGRYEEAKGQLQTSYELLERLHGRDSPRVAETLWRWALAVEATGDRARADSLLQELLLVCDGSREELRLHRALALHESAFINLHRRRFEDAERLFNEAIPLFRQIEGDAGVDLAQSLHALGALQTTTGHLEDGIRTLREALSMKQALYGGEHPDVAECLVDLATSLAEAGHLAEADSLVRLGVEMMRRTLGSEHPMTAESLTGLAEVALPRRDYETAVAAYEEAVRIAQKVGGTGRIDEVTLLWNLAYVLELAGDSEGAASRYREAIAALRRNPTDEGARLSGLLVRFGMNLERRGEYEEAEPLLRECLEIRRRVLPPDDWRNANTMSALGGVICARGRFAEAEPLLRNGYADLAANPQAIPAPFTESAPREALQRLVTLFEAWDAAEPHAGHDQEAARFRAALEAGSPVK